MTELLFWGGHTVMMLCSLTQMCIFFSRWWQMRDLRLLCQTVYTGSYLRWMQLWLLPRTLRDLWRSWSVWCLLLQRVHHTGERQRRLSQDRKSGQLKDWSVLWEEKIRLQEEVKKETEGVFFVKVAFFLCKFFHFVIRLNWIKRCF